MALTDAEAVPLGYELPGSSETPVDIVGAGPAGLAAAITLAKAGRAVRVFEQHPRVGARFHGDFQGMENWTTQTDVLEELVSLGIEPRFDYCPFRAFTLIDAKDREHSFRSGKPLFYIVSRGSEPGTLDQGLRQLATEVGVEIRFEERIERLPAGGIVAHGPRRADGIVSGYVFDTQLPDCAFGAISNDMAPKGYAYLLVWAGRATLATCIFEDFHNERAYLERTVRVFERHCGIRLNNPRRFGGFGNFSPETPHRRGNLLFVGEAAGLQDALFGFGMRLAIVSGHLAGSAIASGQLDRYEEEVAERFDPLLKASATNRYLYEHLGSLGQRLLVRWAQRSDDVGEWFRRNYLARRRTKILYPWVRARRAGEAIGAVEVCKGCDCTWCRCQRCADSGCASPCE